MKNKYKIINELNLSKNICFNKIAITHNKVHITKSNMKVGSSVEVREICNINTILDKYKQDLDITISIDEVILKF